MQTLIELIARLRDPDTGCEWDLAQTPDTIPALTIEEMYELFDVLASDQSSDDDYSEEICEELGDVLFHLAFYARIYEERGKFTFQDVIDHNVKKMIRRHPHIFAGKVYANVAEQKADWTKIKAEEQAEKSPERIAREAKRDGIFGKDIHAMPAMTQAVSIQSTARKHGFDWDNALQALPKVTEELDELRAEMTQQQTDSENSHEKLLGEYGDLLFACLNIGRLLDLDSEAALRKTNQKVMSRFRGMIEDIGNLQQFSELTLAEKEMLWEKQKIEK